MASVNLNFLPRFFSTSHNLPYLAQFASFSRTTFITMPSSRNLDLYKENLERWKAEGRTFEELAIQLNELKGVRVTARTIKNYFRKWDNHERTRTIDTPLLRTRISYLIHEIGLDDITLLEILQEEGHQLKKFALVRIRKELNIYRRAKDRQVAFEDELKTLWLLSTEMEGDSPLDDKGRAYLHEFVRKKGIFIAR